MNAYLVKNNKINELIKKWIKNNEWMTINQTLSEASKLKAKTAVEIQNQFNSNRK